MNKLPLSERDKREIEKMEAIIKLLDGMAVIEVKHILSKIETHFDSFSVINKEAFKLNLSNTLKGF